MLAEILSQKRRDLESIDLVSETERMRNLASQSGPVRSLRQNLTEEREVSLIGEIKRRSPSRGLLAENLDVEKVTRSYEEAGAKAVSVLTETVFFGGSVDDLKTVRNCTELPILRKDFVLEEFQVWEAKALGADAILLIAAILDPETLHRLHTLAGQVGLEVLLEVHTEQELEEALKTGPEIVGINNRDLTSFETDLEVTKRLRPLVPRDVVCVSESGIKSRDHVLGMQDLGIDAVLVGEEIISSPDPGLRIQDLLGRVK
jgi:indole-3-glycerol phosphate synthase